MSQFNKESKKEIPEADREIICFLKQLNYSTHEIGKLIGVESSTVSKTWKRKEETGSIKDRKRSGRSRILSANDEKELLDILSSKKGLSASELHFNYTTQKNKHISKETIRNVLKNNNYTSYIKPKKPFLSKNSKIERYKFAKDHLNWTANDWKKVIFSDEKLAENLEHLWNQVKRIWGTIDINIINNLYESMPERIAAVYKQEG
ncbi:4246_t:CDS:2, partial [Cetraspora pellucida]